MPSNDINPFPLVGIPAGLAMAQAYAITDTEHNTAHEALSDFPFARYIRGANCTDKASDAVHCEIWLEPVGGVRDVADANCAAYIYYNGTHIWKQTVQILGGQTFISFADADCRKPAAPVGIANYQAIIAQLHIKIITYPAGEAEATSAEVLLDATAPGAINSGTVPRSAAAPAGSIEEGLADAEADLYSVVLPGGGLAADVVVPASLNIEANINESDENLFAGRFEEDDDGDGIGNEWLAYGAGATYTLDNTHFETGTLAQRVQAPGPGLGIYGYPTFPHLVGDFKGVSVVAHVRVWCTDADSVIVQMTDGVATVTSPAGGAAGAFASIPLRQDRAAAASNFVVRVYSAFPTDFWVDSINVSLGVTAKAVSSNPWQGTYDLMKTEDGENWIQNGDFRDWTNPVVAVGPPVIRYPDWWAPGPNPPTGSDQDANSYYGTIGWRLNMNAGQSVIGRFLVPNIQIGESGYYTAFIYGNAGVGPVRFAIGTTGGGGASTLDVVPAVGAWRPVIFPFNPTVIADDVIITVSLPAGANDFTLSGLCFNRGLVPIIFKPARPKIYKWDLNHAGAAPMFPSNLTFNGTTLEAVVPSPCFVHKIVVYNAVPPGGAFIDTYDVTLNGAASGLATAIAAAATIGRTHLPFSAAPPPIAFAQDDRLQVSLTPGGGATADISAVVEAIGY